MADEHTPRRERVEQALTGSQTPEPSSFAVTGVLGAVRNVHPMKCPACEETIQATNVEWLYGTLPRDSRPGRVVDGQFVAFSEYSHTDDKEQLYYCPNDDCRVERLTPGEK